MAGRKFKYPPNIREILIAQIAEGKTYAQIAPMVGAPSGKAVKSLAERYSLTRPRGKYHTGDLIRYIRAGLSIEEIAVKTGAPTMVAVKSALKKRGLFAPAKGKHLEENRKHSNALTKLRAQLVGAEDLWIEQLDDRMFDKATEGRGAVVEPDPGDCVGRVADTAECSYGSSQMGWAA